MAAKNINHIQVALYPGEVNRDLLQAATSLALDFEAKLHAFFVEDINLLRLAELPIAREVVYGTHTSRQINPVDMERSLQSQTNRIRKLVNAVAQQNQIEISFEVMRGDITNELCAASLKTDLLIVGKNTRLLDERIKVGNLTRTIISSTNCNLMVWQHGATAEQSVAVFFTGSVTSKIALQLANQLVQSNKAKLTIVYPVSTEQEYKKLKQETKELIKLSGLVTHDKRLQNNSASAIFNLLNQSGAKVLLLESNSELLDLNEMSLLIEQAKIPVILIN